MGLHRAEMCIRDRGKGGEGGLALADEVLRLCEMENSFQFVYPLDAPIREKIELIAKKRCV